MIVGTSTSCSASYGSPTGVRAESSSMRILGTSMTCSGTWISCGAKTSTNSCSSISGTGTSIIGAAMICSTLCRWSRSCGLTSESRSGWENPTAGTSSRSKAKCWVPAAWGVGVLRIDAVWFNSLPPLPAPGRRLSPWGGMVLIRGQEHLQRELLMAPVLTQPALSAATGAPRSTANSCAVNIHDVNS